MTRHILITILALIALPAISSAALTITIAEVGPNVEVSVSGNLNLGMIAPDVANTSLFSSFLNPESASIFMNAGSADSYSNTFGSAIFTSVPAPFGPNNFESASSSSGDVFAINTSGLFVPVGYTNGPITASSQFLGTDLASLMITPGNYQWVLVNGDTVNVTATAVPEPSTIAFLGLALGFGSLWLRSRRRASLKTA